MSPSAECCGEARRPTRLSDKGRTSTNNASLAPVLPLRHCLAAALPSLRLFFSPQFLAGHSREIVKSRVQTFCDGFALTLELSLVLALSFSCFLALSRSRSLALRVFTTRRRRWKLSTCAARASEQKAMDATKVGSAHANTRYVQEIVKLRVAFTNVRRWVCVLSLFLSLSHSLCLNLGSLSHSLSLSLSLALQLSLSCALALSLSLSRVVSTNDRRCVRSICRTF